jgi:CDP-glucose 4,6-dehydratase
MQKADKILVTGGCGFIGGHLIDKLVKRGLRIVVVDIKIHPFSTFAKNRLKDKVKLEIVDVNNRKRIFDLFHKYKPDYVIHLAAKSTVSQSFHDPSKTFKTNIMGTVNILDASRTTGVKGIIVASSDKAYGKTQKPYTEQTPLRGDHPYDVSKSCADLISQAYHKTYNLPVVITRFGNVYGEGDLHFDRIIPGICKAVIEKKLFKIRSNGTYVRDYIFVKDVVDGYIFLLERIEEVIGETFNFSSSDSLSVLNLVKKIEKILQTPIPYAILSIVKNEIPYQHLDSTKIKRLGWKNQYSLKNSFRQVFNWYTARPLLIKKKIGHL